MLGHLNAKLAAPALALALAAVVQSGACGNKKDGGGSNTNAANANVAHANTNANRGGVNRVLGGGQSNVNQTDGGDSSAGRVEKGLWGGDHVRLVVTDAGAEIEFDCAHGRMGSLKTDAQGKFSVEGNFVFERGGGLSSGDKEDSRPAQYSGRVEGKRMTLTVAIKSPGEIAEPTMYTLTHGREGNLTKCL